MADVIDTSRTLRSGQWGSLYFFTGPIRREDTARGRSCAGFHAVLAGSRDNYDDDDDEEEGSPLGDNR